MKIELTKIEVAERQLKTAIELWAKDGDPVSTHALAAAALEILHQLARKKGEGSTFLSLNHIAPERREEMLRLIKKYQNFFKHAGRDPHEILQFNVTVVELFILDAIQTYVPLTGKVVPEFQAFYWHFMHHNPSAFNPDYLLKNAEKLKELRSLIDSMTKAEWLSTIKEYHPKLTPNINHGPARPASDTPSQGKSRG